ncbi:hypothetical protein ACQCSU_14340 [Pseudarthrobacter sp. O4]|uniref:hypothetical protein n=1 Tax=Pseudarthrobacter sp. O4 TaxID=3418417 RepID=UPI003CF9A0B5
MTLQQNRATRSPDRWDDVQIGDRVQLRREGHLELIGRVDNRTADGAVVWVMPDGGTRQLFHAADGYQLTVAAEGTHHEDN